MKLSRINIERYGRRQNICLNRLGEQLNVIIDPSVGDGTLAGFLRGTWFGNSIAAKKGSVDQNVETLGWIEIATRGHSYRLSRPGLDQRQALMITALDSNAHAPSMNFATELEAEIFDTYFCWAYSTRPPLARMIQLVQEKFGRVERAEEWRQRINPLGASGHARQNRLAELHATQTRLSRDLGQHIRRSQAESVLIHEQLTELAAQIEQCDSRIRAANSRRDLLDRQIIEFEQRPKYTATSAQPISAPIAVDPAALLYERLDELDWQWRLWRDVQQNIQQRRVEIRDELAKHADQSLNSTEHPYHRARELVRGLESKLAEAESLSKIARESAASSVGSTQWCQEMRHGLESLCQELEQQYRHVRHRTSAAELKQLRGCYNELEDSVKRLLRRRHSIIEQIHTLDPEGAEMVLRGDQQFCALAQQEGYYHARHRYARPTVPFVRSTPHQADPVSDQWQIDSLRQQRGDVQKEITQAEAELRRLVNQRDIVVDQSNRLLSGERDLRAQLERVEADVRRAVDDIHVPREKNVHRPSLTKDGSSRIFQRAGQFLRRLTGRRWNEVHASGQLENFALLDERGLATPIDQLDSRTQNQFALCLSLAVADHFRQQGETLPMILSEITDLFSEFGTSSLVSVLGESILAGQQILVIVRDSAQAASFANLRPTTFDLTESYQTAAPWNGTITLADSHTFREPVMKAAPAARLASAPTFSAHERGAEPTGELVNRYPINRSVYLNRSNFGSASPNSLINASSRPGWSLTNSLRETGVCQPAELAALERCGIRTIGELLDATPETLARSMAELRHEPEQIRRWQACCWLLYCIPEMAIEDAQVLVECGIITPEQLEEVRGELLMRRISDYLSAAGRSTEIARYNVERINNWMRCLARTRPSWKHLNRNRHQPAASISTTSSRWLSSNAAVPASALSAANSWPSSSVAVGHDISRTPKESHEALRFHLNFNDSVDAAPSIGPRVYQQLVEIGVHTVRDFLNRTAEDIARQLNNRRITSQIVSEWQQQARIACSIPNLRRHDAQILVACGITDPQKLAAFAADDLFDMVNRFVRSKAGMRLIRSGKKPDLAEVSNWIRWARHTRTLQAA